MRYFFCVFIAACSSNSAAKALSARSIVTRATLGASVSGGGGSGLTAQLPASSNCRAIARASVHSHFPVLCLRNSRCSDPDTKIGHSHRGLPFLRSSYSLVRLLCLYPALQFCRCLRYNANGMLSLYAGLAHLGPQNQHRALGC